MREVAASKDKTKQRWLLSPLWTCSAERPRVTGKQGLLLSNHRNLLTSQTLFFSLSLQMNPFRELLVYSVDKLSFCPNELNVYFFVLVLLSSHMAIFCLLLKTDLLQGLDVNGFLMAWDKNAWEKPTFTLKNFKAWSVFTCQGFIKHGIGIQQKKLFQKYGLCIHSHHIPDKLSSISGYFICNPITRREHESGISTIREL